MIARSVFALPKPGSTVVNSNNSIDSVFRFASGLPSLTPTMSVQTMDIGWQELSEMDYFGTWNEFGMQQQDLNGIRT